MILPTHCEYCKEPIVDRFYIYLWQPKLGMYKAVHTRHTKLRGEVTPDEIQATIYS